MYDYTTSLNVSYSLNVCIGLLITAVLYLKMKSPMILAGINIERAKKIAFYLRHDQPLVYLFFRTLRVLNMLVEMITTEMKSIEIDQAYWRRIGAASSWEIYFARLCTHGPINFVNVLLNTVTGTQISNTNNEAEEVEHHLSVLRAKMNDLSCLVACINEASGYLKRSFLVSNNRHYIYIICDISASTSLKENNSRWNACNEDGDPSSLPENNKSHATTASRLLAPLRQLCVEDIDMCLVTLLKMLKRFRSKKFTPAVDGLSTPKVYSGIRGSLSHSSLNRNRSNASMHHSPNRPSGINNERDSRGTHSNVNAGAHSAPNSPNNRNSNYRKQYPLNLNTATNDMLSSQECEYIDSNYVNTVNEQLKTIVATIKDYAPHPQVRNEVFLVVYVCM